MGRPHFALAGPGRSFPLTRGVAPWARTSRGSQRRVPSKKSVILSGVQRRRRTPPNRAIVRSTPNPCWQRIPSVNGYSSASQADCPLTQSRSSRDDLAWRGPSTPSHSAQDGRVVFRRSPEAHGMNGGPAVCRGSGRFLPEPGGPWPLRKVRRGSCAPGFPGAQLPQANHALHLYTCPQRVKRMPGLSVLTPYPLPGEKRCWRPA